MGLEMATDSGCACVCLPNRMMPSGYHQVAMGKKDFFKHHLNKNRIVLCQLEWNGSVAHFAYFIEPY